MKTIMIDLDDTITVDNYIEVVNKYLNTNLTYKDIPGYWVDNIVPENQLQDYLDFIYNKINIYDYGKKNGNVCEIIKKLSEKYNICICSAYIDSRDMANCPNLIKHKFNWLLKNLPCVKPENYIFTSNKKIINAEIKIDDKLENLEGNAEIKILITAYHNKNITDKELKAQNVIRANNWDEIAQILL